MNYFDKELLGKTLPIKRAAYSDRTSYVMAELSRLVYEKLPESVSVKSLVNQISEEIKQEAGEEVLEQLIKRVAQFEDDSSLVDNTLKNAGMSLEKVFSNDNTEAILVKINPTDDFEGMLILAFRGTEINLTDIKTDIKANLVPAPVGGRVYGGRVHKGFMEGFEKVQHDIEETLSKDDYKLLPLYITGHSLGGALAMIATSYLSSDSTGATYTFGGPRAADDKFFEKIKTPVYRVVHNADVVPRVPFGPGFAFFLTLLRMFSVTASLSEWLRKKFYGYTHFGDLIFLSSDSEGNATLRHSPNIFLLYSVVIKRLITTWGKAGVNDHSMSEYSKQLLGYAKQRNQ